MNRDLSKITPDVLRGWLSAHGWREVNVRTFNLIALRDALGLTEWPDLSDLPGWAT